MNWFGALQGLLPYRVNVSGRKAKLIVSVGRTLAPRANHVRINGQVISTSGHALAKIIQYAPVNFMRDFEQSDLGHYMNSLKLAGHLFFDVGANLGGYALLAKRLGMDVVLFEPFPELAAFLKENAHAFGDVHAIALSNETGELIFHISESNIGGSSLVESSLSADQSGYSREIKVEVKRGDEFVGNRKIALLKIDVEGNEYATVRGFEAALRAGHIERIWCEVRGPQSDRNANSCHEVVHYLKQFGYRAFEYKRGLKIPFATEEGIHLPQFFDLLFEQSSPNP